MNLSKRSTPQPQPSTTRTRTMNERIKKLHDDLTGRFGDLLADIIEEAEQAAVECCQDEDTGKPIKAKVSAAIEWEAGYQRPQVKVKLSYSTKHEAASEAKLDFDQETLQFKTVGE